MKHNPYLADISLNELKHVKHRTSNDIHCEKHCCDTGLWYSNQNCGHPESILVFRNIMGHNVYATPKIGLLLLPVLSFYKVNGIVLQYKGTSDRGNWSVILED